MADGDLGFYESPTKWTLIGTSFFQQSVEADYLLAPLVYSLAFSPVKQDVCPVFAGFVALLVGTSFADGSQLVGSGANKLRRSTLPAAHNVQIKQGKKRV